MLCWRRRRRRRWNMFKGRVLLNARTLKDIILWCLAYFYNFNVTCIRKTRSLLLCLHPHIKRIYAHIVTALYRNTRKAYIIHIKKSHISCHWLYKVYRYTWRLYPCALIDTAIESSFLACCACDVVVYILVHIYKRICEHWCVVLNLQPVESWYI